MNIKEPKELLRAFPLGVHEQADLSYENLDDKIEIKLVNKDTGETSERTYYKLDDSMTICEAVKIDTMLYHMHNEIRINLWDKKIK